MNQIRRNRIKLRPRIYFTAGTALMAIGLTATWLLTIIFAHLVFFRLRIQAPFSFLGFGRLGLGPFLAVFPWPLLLLALAGFGGGLKLLKHYDFSYKKSFWALALIGLNLALTLALLLDRLDLPVKLGPGHGLGYLYRQQSFGTNWLTGTVTAAAENQLQLITADGRQITVSWDETTRLPRGNNFQPGETIRAVGRWQNSDRFFARAVGRNRYRWRH